MKLISLHVSSFGKLKDFSYDFNDNLNVIKQDNGWGKSTLATFIKCIFYGLSGTGKRSVDENERLRFKPWNSTEKFGGHVVFEWAGKKYKVERFFGAKDSDDTITLTDVETGKNFSNTENLGQRVFQIDEEGFLSTTYFSQKDFKVKSNTSITNKYNSVCEINDVQTFDDAVKKLEEKAKEFKAVRGEKGKIFDTKQDIAYLNQKIADATKAGALSNMLEQSVQGLIDETNELKIKKDALSNKVRELGEKKALLEQKKNYDELILEKDNAIKLRNQKLSKTGGKVPSRQEIERHSNVANEIYSLERTKLELQASSSAFAERIQTKAAEKGASLWLILLALSALFAIGGIVSFVLAMNIVGIILLTLSAICGAFTIIKSSSSKREKDRINSVVVGSGEKIKEIEQMIALYRAKVDEFLRSYGLETTNYSIGFNDLTNYINDIAIIDEKISYINSRLSKFDEKSIEIYKNIEDGEDFSKVNLELSNIQSDYDRKYVELVNKQNERKKYIEMFEELPELENKKTFLAEQLETYIEEHKILDLTHKFLIKADENLKIKYRAPLKESLNKYFALITGKDNSVEIDIDLNVTGVEKEGNKIPEYYSKGYQNLFEICKRFALTDVLFTAEKPFIILDDPFYNLDDQKIVCALELMQKLSNEYQIIYFVCHDSRVI